MTTMPDYALRQLAALRILLFSLLGLLLLILYGVVQYRFAETKVTSDPFCGVESPQQKQHPAYLKGKELFIANCASCHNKNMVDPLTGPPLRPAIKAWADYPEKDLYAFIRNSQKSVKARQPRAVKIWNEYKPTIMPAFSGLTDQEIQALIAYINPT